MPSTLKTFVAGAAIGGAAAYLLDRSSGAQRRRELQATAQGVVAKVQHAAGSGESAPPPKHADAPPPNAQHADAPPAQQPANLGSSS